MKLFYIGEFDFDIRQTGATVRVLNNCKAIKQSNYLEVTIIGYANIKRMIIDQFNVINLKKGSTITSKIWHYIFRGFEFTKLIKNIQVKPDIIIYYGISSRILLPLKSYCKNNDIKLVVDVVEWYDYSNVPFGKYGPIALDVHIAMTRIIPKCDGVISISTFLENYFKNMQVPVIRIPPLADSKSNLLYKENNANFDTNYINLIYAGYAGKKDFIFNVAKAVINVNKKGIKVHFHIIGMTLDEFTRLSSGMKNVENITCYGRIPNTEVYSYLKQADFTVLIRPVKRFTKAGFPSKFVESMNLGLPVIANITSDLSLYLKDGYNGYIVKDSSVLSFEELIIRINNVYLYNKESLRMNAKNTAVSFFDYRLYSDYINNFLINL